MQNRRNYNQDNSVDMYSFSSSTQSQGRKKGRNKKRVWTNIISSLVLVACIASMGYIALYTPLFAEGRRDDGFERVEQSREGLSYFLVLGIDECGLTDLMMVLKMDHDNDTGALLQIPRDLFVGAEVATGGTGKVNAVYPAARAGETNVNAVKRVVNQYLGLPIDHHIILQLDGFRNIVDAVDGVPIYLERQMMVTNEFTPVPYPIGPGDIVLNGLDAESFVRHRRSFATGDLGRMESQRHFMIAFAQRIQTMSGRQTLSVAQSSFGQVSTSLTIRNMLSYVGEVRDLDLDNIFVAAVPGQSGTFTPSGFRFARSYFSIHKQDYVDLINEHFLPPDKQVTIYDLRIQELHTRRAPSQTFDPGTMADD